MYLSVDELHKIIFSSKKNEMRATYALSPETPKKSSSTAAVIPVARLPEMQKKKKKYAVKLEGILHTTT